MIYDKNGNELKKGDIVAFCEDDSIEMGILVRIENSMCFIKNLNPVIKGNRNFFIAMGFIRRMNISVIKIDRAKFLVEKNKYLYVVKDNIEEALMHIGNPDNIVELDGDSLKNNPEFLF